MTTGIKTVNYPVKDFVQASGSVQLESGEEIEAKFHDNAQRTLSAQRADALLRAIDSLEQRVGALLRLAAG